MHCWVMIVWMLWCMLVIVYFFPATCRREFRRCRRRTLPSHWRLWPRTVCQWRQANLQNSNQCPTFLHSFYHVLTIHVLLHWVGIIVVVLGQTPHTLYLSGEIRVRTTSWICLGAVLLVVLSLLYSIFCAITFSSYRTKIWTYYY